MLAKASRFQKLVRLRRGVEMIQRLFPVAATESRDRCAFHLCPRDDAVFVETLERS